MRMCLESLVCGVLVEVREIHDVKCPGVGADRLRTGQAVGSGLVQDKVFRSKSSNTTLM